MGYHTCILCQN